MANTMLTPETARRLIVMAIAKRKGVRAKDIDRDVRIGYNVVENGYSVGFGNRLAFIDGIEWLSWTLERIQEDVVKRVVEDLWPLELVPLEESHG